MLPMPHPRPHPEGAPQPIPLPPSRCGDGFEDGLHPLMARAVEGAVFRAAPVERRPVVHGVSDGGIDPTREEISHAGDPAIPRRDAQRLASPLRVADVDQRTGGWQWWQWTGASLSTRDNALLLRCLIAASA